MPKAAGHVGTHNSDADSDNVVSRSLERIQARIHRDLTHVERAVSTLFDRELEPTEILESLELCDALGVKFGMLGFGVSAELMRRTAVAFDDEQLGMSSAIAMATMLEDARSSMVTTIEDARSLGATGPALTVVGRESETLDDLIWVASSQGMPVQHIVEGVPSGDQDAAAIVLVADHPDLEGARGLVRGLRDRFPSQPLLVLTPPGTLGDREPIVDLVTTIMPRSLPPSEVVMECRRAVVRASHPVSVSVLGQQADWVARELCRMGIIARSETSDEDLLISLQTGESRGALLLPNPDGTSADSIVRAIRTDRSLRPSVVMVVSLRSDAAARHQLLRDGADGVFGADAELDDVVVALKSELRRRGDLEPVTDPDARHGAIPWANAAVLVERLLTISFRRNVSMGLAVIRLPASAGPDDLDEQIAREFRRDDVIARKGKDSLIIALQGVGRRTLLKRVTDIHQKYSLDEMGVRSAGAEFPSDGRSVNELIERASATLDAVTIEGGPLVVGADWRPDTDEAADVLIVDPDETLGSVLVPLLGRNGLRATHEMDSLNALDLLTGHDRKPLPSIVLLELDLYGIDGLQFLRQVRDAGALERTTVIILSARTGESDLRQAFELGAEDVVTKPFSSPLLLHRISRAMERK